MDGAQIDKILMFIRARLKSEFSLDDVASHIGYSAFHFARAFKAAVGMPVMEYVRREKVNAAAKDIAAGRAVFDVGLEYGFDTHAGFTKAFAAEFGCTPSEYFRHTGKPKTKGSVFMDTANMKIRLICKDDVRDLWENVYSAMTPRQITEVKILPSIEHYERHTGFHMVAEVGGTVVMALPCERLYSMPAAFVFDNCYCLQNNENDAVMEALLNGTARIARQLGITTLMMYQPADSEYTRTYEHYGFTKVFTNGEWDYLMKAI